MRLMVLSRASSVVCLGKSTETTSKMLTQISTSVVPSSPTAIYFPGDFLLQKPGFAKVTLTRKSCLTKENKSVALCFKVRLQPIYLSRKTVLI